MVLRAATLLPMREGSVHVLGCGVQPLWSPCVGSSDVQDLGLRRLLTPSAGCVGPWDGTTVKGGSGRETFKSRG